MRRPKGCHSRRSGSPTAPRIWRSKKFIALMAKRMDSVLAAAPRPSLAIGYFSSRLE